MRTALAQYLAHLSFCQHVVDNLLPACAQGTPSLEELKLQYYRLYIQYYQQEHNYLEICRCYRAIYNTPSILADSAQWQPVWLGCTPALRVQEC